MLEGLWGSAHSTLLLHGNEALILQKALLYRPFSFNITFRNPVYLLNASVGDSQLLCRLLLLMQKGLHKK